MMIRNRKCCGMMVCGLALMLLLGGCGNVYAVSGFGVLQNGRREHAGESDRPERKEREEGRETGEEPESKDRGENGWEAGKETGEEPESKNRGEDSREESKEAGGEADHSESRDRDTESAGSESSGYSESDRGQNGESGDSGMESEKPEKEKPVGFGSVPYFRDDSCSNTQLSDGWIYGYWSRQLCRVNADTLESEVLFETDSPQDGFFSIYNGMIYFLEQSGVSSPEGKKANLWRMNSDGSRRELIVEDFAMPDGYMEGMEIYDDILYLLSRSQDQEDNRYFRLKKDGGAEQISREETLFSMVPEGWHDAGSGYFGHEGLRNIVYCVRNYGYGFLCDESGNLYRIIPETGEKEQILLPNTRFPRNVTLTNDALVYRDSGEVLWYSVSLDDLEEITEIGEMNCYIISFWDEKGIYTVDRTYGSGSFSIERLNWSGEKETLDYWVSNPRLNDSVYGDSLTVLYSDGTYLYYDGLSDGDGVIYRIALEEDDGEAEQVFVYYENPVIKISTRETFSTTFTVEETGDKGEFSMTKVYLTENTEAADKINAFLEEIYRSEEEYIAELMDDVRGAAVSDWGHGWDMLLVEDELSASVSYLDDSYIGISFFWYEYWGGAAHGQHGNVEYVFSRLSGERILLTDIVENSEEEICAIIAPYVEAEAEWGTDEEGWERIILDEGRFYLTVEGIGIHFDTYELSSYASGGLDVVVPYELFDMKNPADVGLTSF